MAIAQGEWFASEDANLPHLVEALGLASSERFLNWQVAFPGVWSQWEASELTGGFDAVIGNPPWDRMKLQQVEWFAARRPEIALAPRAADRKRMIAKLQKTQDPLAEDFRLASARAAAGARVARTSGDYPLLARGDLNLYSLFVERAMTLVKPDGMVGLLVPVRDRFGQDGGDILQERGDGGATPGTLRLRRTGGRAGTCRRSFPDIHSVGSSSASSSPSPSHRGMNQPCTVRLSSYMTCRESRIRSGASSLSAADFARVNPNTGTAPIFRSRRDAELTTAIYDRLPVLVDRSSGEAVKAWPVKYSTMFHMTNDSDQFRTRSELEERGRRVAGGRQPVRQRAGRNGAALLRVRWCRPSTTGLPAL